MTTNMEEKQPNKPHQPQHKSKSGHDIHNIKANGYFKGERARQAIAHQVNIEQIRLDQPEKRAYNYQDPPLLIAVQGPPGCGKSLLIKCLVKYFSKELKLIDIRGPITVVAHRSQRITFIEVPNDINSMCDIAKVADLVLLMVNAQRNFEMETFEFLHLLLSHGFPKVIGILTHLDLCHKSVANELIARFHKELSTTVKVYKLERLIHNRYEKNSIKNLARKITIPKVRVINFRKNRGYVLVDRAESGTSQDGGKSTLLYGYCRGDGLSNGQRIHIPGAGDFTISSIKELQDPCPLSDPKNVSQRSLRQQSNLIYAPMSEIGGVKIDENAIYVDLPKHQINFTSPDSESLKLTEEEASKLKEDIQVTKGVEMVRQLQQKSSNEKNEDQNNNEDMLEILEGLYVPVNEKNEVQNSKVIEKKEEVPQQKLESENEEEEEEEYEEEEANEEAAVKNEEEDSEEEVMNNMEDFIPLSDEDDIGDNVELNPDGSVKLPSGEIQPGKYARIEFTDIPPSLIQRFDPKIPIIIGSLLEEEKSPDNCQQWVKIRRDRFYDRTPKSSDPMVFTIGWRRFQTIPIFFNEERDNKLRHLKYMPEYLTCYASYWGPPSAINIGVTTFQHIKENLRAFRVTATGVTIKQMGEGKIVKKLRVKGHPKDIFKKTAKITDMFTSDLEAGQFVGALVKTVSGIRGKIKKVEKDGVVRCTFEDTIKPSDIVFLNGWVKVPVEKFCQTIDSLLTDNWNLVRTTAELRADLNLRPQYKEDSVYREVVRPELPELKLTAPQNLKAQLPYKIRKQHEEKPAKRAVILNEDEAEIMSMLRKTREVFDAKRNELAKQKSIEQTAAKKAAEKEEKEKLHKRTLNKQEFFKRNPKRAKK